MFNGSIDTPLFAGLLAFAESEARKLEYLIPLAFVFGIVPANTAYGNLLPLLARKLVALAALRNF
jgi:hypothetical protein